MTLRLARWMACGIRVWHARGSESSGFTRIPAKGCSITEAIFIQSVYIWSRTNEPWGLQVVTSVESGKAELFMDEHGILQLRWARNAIIRSGDAEAAMQMVNELCGQTERPLLVHMATTSAVSRGARTVFSRTCQASHVALLGASPVDKVIANFVLAMNKTTRPKRYFTSRAEAMAWLMTRITA
jgi:hypothetical protein